MLHVPSPHMGAVESAVASPASSSKPLQTHASTPDESHVRTPDRPSAQVHVDASSDEHAVPFASEAPAAHAANQVVAPASTSPRIQRMVTSAIAMFARNASKWIESDGGDLRRHAVRHAKVAVA
jgi:hypothetical protein